MSVIHKQNPGLRPLASSMDIRFPRRASLMSRGLATSSGAGGLLPISSISLRISLAAHGDCDDDGGARLAPENEDQRGQGNAEMRASGARRSMSPPAGAPPCRILPSPCAKAFGSDRSHHGPVRNAPGATTGPVPGPCATLP